MSKSQEVKRSLWHFIVRKFCLFLKQICETKTECEIMENASLIGHRWRVLRLLVLSLMLFCEPGGRNDELFNNFLPSGPASCKTGSHIVYDAGRYRWCWLFTRIWCLQLMTGEEWMLPCNLWMPTISWSPMSYAVAAGNEEKSDGTAKNRVTFWKNLPVIVCHCRFS